MIHPIGTKFGTYEEGEHVLLTDRGHHIVHIAQMINNFLVLGDELDVPAYYTRDVFKKRAETMLIINERLEELDFLERTVGELLKTRWFNGFISLIVHSAIKLQYYSEVDREKFEWDSFNDYIIQILTYIAKKFWPTQYSNLINENGEFDIKIDEISSPIIDSIDIFLVRYADDLTILSEEDANVLLTVFICLLDNYYRHILILTLGNKPDLFPKAISAFRQLLVTERDYYIDVNVTDDTIEESMIINREFVEKVIETYCYDPEGLIVFNNNPGELCRTAFKEDKECGKHCLRHRIADIDLWYLEVVAEFKRTYPNLGNQIKVIGNGIVQEVAFPVSLFGNKDFREFIFRHKNSEEG